MQKAPKIVLSSWIRTFQFGKEAAKKNPIGYVYFLGQDDSNKFRSLVEDHALTWQAEALRKNEREVVYFSGQKGPVWVVRAKSRNSRSQHEGLLEDPVMRGPGINLALYCRIFVYIS